MEACINNPTGKHPGGRPLKYTPEEINALLDDYIRDCKDYGNPVLITSFAIYIKTDRSTLQDYAARDEFSPIIKRLEDACEDCAVRYLYSGKNPAGVIFYLKNKHGWTDKQEININESITIQIGEIPSIDAITARLEARLKNVTPPTIALDLGDSTGD